MKTERLLLILRIGFLVAALVFAVLFFFEYKKIRLNKELEKNGQKEEIANEIKENYTHANETVYNGDPWLPAKLFQFPFKKSNLYVSNRELYARFGEENISTLLERANLITESVFSPFHSSVSLDDIISDQLYVYLPLSDKELDTGTEFTEYISKWFDDNNVTIEATLNSAPCMVYSDLQHIIVRGQTIFTVWECDKPEALNGVFGIENVELGKEYVLITELYLIPSPDGRFYYDKYMATDLSVLYIYEQEQE